MAIRWLQFTALVLVGCISDSSPRSPSAESKDQGPDERVVATVLGASISESDLQSTSLDALILDPLFSKYRSDKGITATKEEIKACWRAFERRTDEPRLAFDSDDVIDDDALALAEGDEVAWEFAKRLVIDWKTSKQMYQDYGGTVIWQQANPLEPVGAYLAFLKEQERVGAFRIYDMERASSFWACFIREDHPFVVPPTRVDFSVPPWEKSDWK